MKIEKHSKEITVEESKFKVKILYDRCNSLSDRGYFLLIRPIEINIKNISIPDSFKYYKYEKFILIEHCERQSDKRLEKMILDLNLIAEPIINVMLEEIIMDIARIKTKEKMSTECEGEPTEREYVKIKLSDIGGLEEIKEDLKEIIDYIKEPEEYKAMNIKMPKGILLYGPPGTGKTLLAKAIAGETEVGFFNVSGSEFIEKYVGVGAKRVRELFRQAKKLSPAIIYIDEVDAIGSKRENELNKENNMTLNQLLVELDGFSSDDNVFVIASTNRKDMLDKALIRSGRFDRHLYVGMPDVKTRINIFKKHLEDKPTNNINVEQIARETHGISGADIANICNEAGILAIREKLNEIHHKHLEKAYEKQIIGLKSKSKEMLHKEKEIVAYHEAGHALASYILSDNKISKISIIPHGESLGHVINTPNEDKYLHSKEEILNKIKILLAGKAAEELIFKVQTSGVSDDLKKSTNLVLNMVYSYGMDKSFGLLNREIKDVSDLKESELYNLKFILDGCYNDVLDLLQKNIDKLNKIAKYLIEFEQMDYNDLENLMDFSALAVN